jgi:RND superfamily putative drug exporter
MPRRFIDRGHPEDGAWGRWARFVLRRPVAVAAVGLLIVAGLVGLGTQLNPTEAQLKNFPGTGSAIAARDQLAAAGSARRDEAARRPRRERRQRQARRCEVERSARRCRSDRAAGWQKGRTRSSRGSPRSTAPHPASSDHRPRQREPRWTDGTLTGLAAVDRDFLHALFGSFPYVVGLVLLLTMILLTRAFRSLVLAIKAVVLNLVSLAAPSGSSSSSSRWATAPGSGTSPRPGRSRPGSR